MADAHQKHHDYHIIDPSPWPLTGSIGALIMALGGIGWMQGMKGAEVYMAIYRWFTEISGLGLSMQAAKLMNPDPIKKEADL